MYMYHVTDCSFNCQLPCACHYIYISFCFIPFSLIWPCRSLYAHSVVISLGIMFYLALLICILQALNLVQSLPSHNLHEHLHHLIHRQAKSPQDLTTLGTQVIPTPLNEPKNLGSVNPALETKGITSVVPFVTNIPTASVRQKADPYAQVLLAPQVAQPTPQAAVVNGIFDNPIDTARPPNTIGTKDDHPQPKTGIVCPHLC